MENQITELARAQVRRPPQRASRDTSNLLRVDVVRSRAQTETLPALVRVAWPLISGVAPEELAVFALNIMTAFQQAQQGLERLRQHYGVDLALPEVRPLPPTESERIAAQLAAGR